MCPGRPGLLVSDKIVAVVDPMDKSSVYICKR